MQGFLQIAGTSVTASHWRGCTSVAAAFVSPLSGLTTAQGAITDEDLHVRAGILHDCAAYKGIYVIPPMLLVPVHSGCNLSSLSLCSGYVSFLFRLLLFTFCLCSVVVQFRWLRSDRTWNKAKTWTEVNRT